MFSVKPAEMILLTKALIDGDIFKTLELLLLDNHCDIKTKKEAIWAVSNSSMNQDPQQIR